MAYGKRTYNTSYTKRPSYTKPEPVAFVAPTFTPSAFQASIIDAIETTRDNLIVSAVAGSGKTSTLALVVASLLKMRASYVVVAFNKPIATELQSRGMNGRTFHSIGYGAVMNACAARNNGVKPEMNGRKVADLIGQTYTDCEGYAGALERLVSLMKNHMMMPTASDDDIMSLVDHFDLEWSDEQVDDRAICQMARDVLGANNRNTRVIDFDDQLYFVHLWNLTLPTFDFVLVDESQDTNPLRRALAARMLTSTSRIVAVGDERQAIYGFTGASHDSMQLIQEAFSCRELPLSVSYRCPRAVVALAQTIVPHIEARPDAPEGTVTHARSFKRSEFLPTDLLLCRNTMPLVQTAYKLLSSRIPCRIMGREIGKSLTAVIKRVSRKNETLETLADRLEAHKIAETEKAIRQKKESRAQAVQDKVDAILSILDSMTPEDADGGVPRLVAIIEAMFSDTQNGCVTLATVHKAKGLEAPRVFILDPGLMPSKMAKQDWQIVQERNLMYVAYTRSLDTLIFVDTKTLTD